ncbi:MAG: 3-deoxy-manno-octulosonate cytidylyltransferase [Acidobacteria bacterium]|nr:3-deoxy-manno-octulosonate cytidylyltransferase [Acidobacteriota bacterium]
MKLPAIGVIPVRFASTRFPGKALADLGGKPMIERVCERARQAQVLERVLVATDDERIFRAVEAIGIEVCMTSAGHRSGTERVAEVVKTRKEPIVVVIQGDEPLIDPDGIDRSVAALRQEPDLAVCTLAEVIDEPEEVFDPNIVKVVLDGQGDALYFSRSPVPYLRGEGDLESRVRAVLLRREKGQTRYLKHIGLYAFRRENLLKFVALPECESERTEALEQLRWLHAGARVRTLLSPGRSIGVDTPADLEKVRRLMTSESQTH